MEEQEKSQMSESGSQVSSRDVSLEYSNIMNISSMRGSLNESNSSDIKKKTRTPKSKPAKLHQLVAAEGDPQTGSAGFSYNPREHPTFEEDHFPNFSPLEKAGLHDSRNRQEYSSIDQFYRNESEKMNIWTYLFHNLNKAVRDMFVMCEHEGKKEFCEGVIEVLDEAKSELIKLSNKITVEESKGKLCAWDINQSLSHQDHSNFEEYKHFAVDVSEEDVIEFKMLNEMISLGKMSFYEAVVLIVRERAMVIDQNQASGTVVGLGNHSNLGLGDSNDALSERSKSPSFNGNKVQISELLRRVNLKGRYKKQSTMNHETNDEDKKREIEQRHQRAMDLREEMKSKKKEKLQKKEERLELIRKKREETEKERLEEFMNKFETSSRRRTNYIDEIKKKAREVNLRATELSFLSTLDKDLKRTTITRKLLETHERRIAILNRFREKKKKEDENILQVQMRKEEIDNEKKSQLMSKFDKYEEATKRRADLMEKRYPVYGLADVTVESRRGVSHEAMARAILAAVEAHDRAHADRPPCLETLS